MKKENKGLVTRKGYRNKKILKKIKRTFIILFIGFVLGLVYSNLFIYNDMIKAAENEENNEVIQIDEVEPKEEEIAMNLDVCNLDKISCEIKKVADSYGIDYKLAIAISKHETGSYTSYAFKELNNVGGMMYWNGTKMQLKYFENLENGIDSFISNLKYNYIDLGLDTIEEIQKKYAPVGINDNGTNQYWVSGVNRYYNELEK